MLISLNANEIIAHIHDKQLANKINLHIFQEIDSTNSFLKNINNQDYLTICCAEHQTQGRGRLGRTWHSPYGENIYLSLRWLIKDSIDKLSTLSLTTGISIIQTLTKFGISEEIAIKWPNDIYYKNKKLAGILIEITHHHDNYISVIIGVGVNVNSDFRKKSNDWSSLLNITNKEYNRNILIAELISNIQYNLQILLTDGFSSFLSLWNMYDYLYNKEIIVKHMNKQIQGVANGINSYGELQLICNKEEVIYLKSGETTLSK